jgi:hypothetical protein
MLHRRLLGVEDMKLHRKWGQYAGKKNTNQRLQPELSRELIPREQCKEEGRLDNEEVL